jgi:hypothetical protein
MRRNTFLKNVIAILSVALFISGNGFAQCATPSEEGTWKNIDVNTRSITKIVVRFQCQDQILNGQPYPPGAPYYLHLFGKCSPSDCDWGEVESNRTGSGWLFSTYNQGFAKRYVHVRMSQRYRGKLFVYIYTDFTDPQRADYSVSNWFDKI